MNKEGNNLFTAISQPQLEDSIKEFAEIKIDSEIPEGVIQEIPLVKSLFGIIKVARGINDFLFIKKLSIFIFEIYKISLDEREELVEKIKKDDKYGTKIGEKVIYLLNRFDDNEKPSLLAKIFIAYLKDQITLEELIRIAHGIERMLMINKDYLIAIASNQEDQLRRTPSYVFQNLGDAGFVDLSSGWEELVSQINDLGIKFIKYVLHKDIP